MDLSDAYANGKYIADADAIAAAWAPAAAAFRKTMRGECDIPYGDSARQTLDLFYPKQAPQGLFMFVHGGYWMEFDKSYWSHFAQGAVDAGWAAALPNYDLCPDVSITDIGVQIAKAISAAAAHVGGPIILCGHSAGGHLVTRVMCDGSSLPDEVAARVRRVVGISGLYDLRPLLHTDMNETLQLTPAEAERESPLLLTSRAEFEMLAWVGEEERPAFVEQSMNLVPVWRDRVPTSCHREPGYHHFNVIDELQNAQSGLMRAALKA